MTAKPSGSACAECVPKQPLSAASVQVMAYPQAVCKTAIVADPKPALQNGPFCTRQLRSAERQQGAQIGGTVRCSR